MLPVSRVNTSERQVWRKNNGKFGVKITASSAKPNGEK